MCPGWIPDRRMFNPLTARIASPLNGERARACHVRSPLGRRRVRGESDRKRPQRGQCLNRFDRHTAWIFVLLGFALAQSVWPSRAGEPSPDRPSIVLQNESARLVMDLNGGSLGEFRFLDRDLNPLQWASPKRGETNIHGFGHFLCLDRWGPASAAEAAQGMPYHGEAANVAWSLVRGPAPRDEFLEAEASARLPKAGLSIRRTLRLSQQAAACAVREEVTNENPLGRIYNAVQHPTIGPPFLDANTIVDCNGRRGFAQGGALPSPEEPSFFWPQALNRDGDSVNMRRLVADPNPNVVSYVIEESHGWVTAASPRQGLLIGYVWKTSDYPWVSLWRDVHDGNPAARGLEFGTTGLHQPFGILVKKGRIWDRPLFEHLDAGQAVSKRYLMFLCRVPEDFGGVDSLEITPARLRLRERGQGAARDLTVEIAGLLPQ